MTNHPDWWDPYSCQPYKLEKSDKPRIITANLYEYSKILLTTLGISAAVAWQYGKLTKKRQSSMIDFAGLSISTEEKWQDPQLEMVEELGVKNLLIRISSWQQDSHQSILQYMEKFENKDFVINVLQDPTTARNPELWKKQLHEVFSKFSHCCTTFKIGNAVNRSKWGCRHTGDALRMFQISDELRQSYPNLKLLGSSIIDFEPLLMQRTLFNFYKYQMDGCAALLYINRRGSPFGKQYKYFDLERKIRLNKAMLKVSNNTNDALWITETNWPLLDTRPYTPNSGHPRSTVDEQTQAEYLKQYFDIAISTGWVERVYWWQLINPGYGLVDHRQGDLRKMPSYYAFQSLFENQESQEYS